jgi:5-dehydro-2-deoxygluconokinase
VPKTHAGILVDEQFGAAILRDARARGFLTAAPAEKSGQHEFDFEYGDDYARHIEAFAPTFCKVLVRYNPEGDAEMNRRQAGRLRQLSAYLHRTRRKFMFELLVPAEQAELEELHGDKRAYDRRSATPHGRRDPRGQDAGVGRASGRPRVTIARRTARPWSPPAPAAPAWAASSRRGGTRRSRSGSPRPDPRLHRIRRRTTFWDALVGWRDGRTTREAAVAEVARRYTRWCQLFAQRAESR